MTYKTEVEIYFTEEQKQELVRQMKEFNEETKDLEPLTFDKYVRLMIDRALIDKINADIKTRAKADADRRRLHETPSPM